MPLTDFTYSGDPSTSDLDKVRFLIMDVDAADPQLRDNEINYLITAKGSVTAAAIAACERLIFKYSRHPDVTFGPSSVSGSQRVQMYKEALATLRRDVGLAVMPFAGGIGKASKDVYEGDSDRVAPTFRRATHSAPGDRLSDFPDD